MSSSATAVSPFVEAMDSINHRTIGENGAVELSAKGVGESRVALFFALVRDCSNARVKELIHLVLEDVHKDSPDVLADLFILAFQTRNCRGGKGERDLFYVMIMEMACMYPETTKALMPLIPRYGSFKDWFNLINLATSDKTDMKTRQAMEPIVNYIYNLAKDQLLQDSCTLERMTSEEDTTSSSSSSSSDKKKSPLSLIAKWAPREKKRFGKQVSVLASKLFPPETSKAPKKEYRQLLVRLNKALNTPEITMSANKWDTIDFTTVPSVSLLKHRKAFLNEKVKGGPLRGTQESETGNRHPHDACRVECRKRLRDAMLQQDDGSAQKKLKGRQLYPHNIVQKIDLGYGQSISEMEEKLFACQWQDIRESVISAMEKVREKEISVSADTKDNAKDDANPGHPAIDLGQIVPLVDVSGSMNGTPMEVAISLGILVSEIASPAYANRCLTFSETPEWVEFGGAMSLVEKVTKMRNAHWGMNTNFEAAMEKILDVAVQAKLEPHETPTALLVLSDMQFDEASDSRSNWETHHERIVRRFKSVGYTPPHIIYWNLRGNTVGFPTQANTPDVTMVSGFSPSIMKLLLDGEPLKDEGREERNPYTTVRKALDDEDYDVVRKVLSDSMEGLLAFYKMPEPLDKEAKDTKVCQGEKEKKGTDSWEFI